MEVATEDDDCELVTCVTLEEEIIVELDWELELLDEVVLEVDGFARTYAPAAARIKITMTTTTIIVLDTAAFFPAARLPLRNALYFSVSHAFMFRRSTRDSRNLDGKIAR